LNIKTSAPFPHERSFRLIRFVGPVHARVSSVMLSWVALFNHFPLVFPDTLSYATTVLRGETPGMFSVFYSLFILPLHQGVTLWPVVFVQGAMLGHLLYLVIRCVSGGNVGKLQTLLVVAALCSFSSLPWFTGQLMPDVFTSVVILETSLLASDPRRPRRQAGSASKQRGYASHPESA